MRRWGLVWAGAMGTMVTMATAACGDDKTGGSGPGDTTDTASDVADTADTNTTDTKVLADTLDTSTPDTADTADTAVADTTPDTVDTVDTVDTLDTFDTAVDTAPDVTVPPKEVRFIVMGDTGEGNERQYKVAEAIRQKCERDGCDFAILLGDNIYDVGVTSTMDAQWTAKFEDPYKNLDMPFYAVLGNHDNGGFLTQFLGDTFAGAGAEFERGNYQVDYTRFSSKWKMPGRTYDFAAGPAHFFALDTNDMVWSLLNNGAEARTQVQVDTLPAKIDQAPETWRIAFGHHPFLSNGQHGDAGAYEGLEENITDLISGVPGLGDLSDVVTGDGVKDALDVIVCGRVDLYFAGHDHSRQWLADAPACPGTTFVVSGAGSKMTTLKERHPYLFQDVDNAGFFWVHLRDDALTAEAIDENGRLQWSHEAHK